MPGRSDPNLRLLAPAAVAVFAVAFLVIILSSGALTGGGVGDRSGESAADRDDRDSRRSARRRARSTYTVRAGDTLGSIAERTDTSVERLQELNPQLDPQALTAGQRIKLRE